MGRAGGGGCPTPGIMLRPLAQDEQGLTLTSFWLDNSYYFDSYFSGPEAETAGARPQARQRLRSWQLSESSKPGLGVT